MDEGGEEVWAFLGKKTKLTISDYKRIHDNDIIYISIEYIIIYIYRK